MLVVNIFLGFFKNFILIASRFVEYNCSGITLIARTCYRMNLRNQYNIGRHSFHLWFCGVIQVLRISADKVPIRLGKFSSPFEEVLAYSFKKLLLLYVVLHTCFRVQLRGSLSQWRVFSIYPATKGFRALLPLHSNVN